MRSFITLAALSFSMAVPAQEPNDMIELLRSDVRNERPAIVMSTLNLTEAQRKEFMPIYDAYTEEMKAQWATRLTLVDDYAQNRETLIDAQATSYLKRLFELEKEDIAIREKYAQKASKVLPATIASRWIVLERRLGQLLELQVANEVPVDPAEALNTAPERVGMLSHGPPQHRQKSGAMGTLSA